MRHRAVKDNFTDVLAECNESIGLRLWIRHLVISVYAVINTLWANINLIHTFVANV
jgi:hypothetical protein